MCVCVCLSLHTLHNVIAESFRKVPEGSGRLWQVWEGSWRSRKVPEGSERFWKVPEGSGRFCKVPESSGRSGKVPEGSMKLVYYNVLAASTDYIGQTGQYSMQQSSPSFDRHTVIRDYRECYIGLVSFHLKNYLVLYSPPGQCRVPLLVYYISVVQKVDYGNSMLSHPDLFPLCTKTILAKFLPNIMCFRECSRWLKFCM